MHDYDLEYPPSVLRTRVRQEFLKNKEVKEPFVIDMLVFKGRLELQETVEIWKTRSHVEKYFDVKEVRKKTELEKFFSGEEGRF